MDARVTEAGVNDRWARTDARAKNRCLSLFFGGMGRGGKSGACPYF